MNILITICGRAGSKGVPGKNIISIKGKPLIYYTIKCAYDFASLYNADVSLSTDSSLIRSVAVKYGLETYYRRPKSLATDRAGKVPVINHLLIWEESERKKTYDYIIDLDITSPLRSVGDIDGALACIIADSRALNIFSVSTPQRNPYFNQVEEKANSYYSVVKTPPVPVLARQNAPVVWDVNASIYIYRREFFSGNFKNAYTDKSRIYPINHICFDLDEKIDYEFMEYLLTNNRLDFPFKY